MNSSRLVSAYAEARGSVIGINLIVINTEWELGVIEVVIPGGTVADAADKQRLTRKVKE
jgi:hypothetical protein